MDTNRPQVTTYVGVSLVSMAALANQIILTRIFSVTLFYHFAFSVISIALLGSGAAGVWLHLGARRLEGNRAKRLLVWLAGGFSLALLAAFAAYTRIPFTVGFFGVLDDASQVGYLLLIYPILTVPYLLAGGALALAVTHYQAHAGRIYFADLAGGGLGCVLSVIALNLLGGAGAVVAVAFIAALAALAFGLAAGASESGTRSPVIASGVLAAVAAIGLAWQATNPWLKLSLEETYHDQTPIYEAWNAYSRITVYEDQSARPFGWGISRAFLDSELNTGDPGRYLILIDEKAGTPILQYSGVTHEPWYEYLRWDLTALPYYLRGDAEVFIIGPGGGKDVVTAYEFDAADITGVELNPIIVSLVENDYGEYSGYIYHSPKVHIETGDARTYLAASDEQFDVIQASLIDTLAASSAGAFALSENGIYTREAFLDYYDHLTDDGLVNFSRWYFPAGPAESLRLVAMGLDAWRRAGVDDPARHVIVVVNPDPDMLQNEGLAAMLLKKTPFTPDEVARVNEVADRMAFDVLYAPGQPDDNPVSDLILSGDYVGYARGYPLDIVPPTDDRPFFFNVVRLTDLGQEAFAESAIYRFGTQAETLLMVTLGVTVALAAVMIVLPVALAGRGRVTGNGRYVLYFAALGLAFILIEIPMVQRLSIYLGSPTYSLVVVLFALLVFSGLGSALTQRVPLDAIPRSLRLTLAALAVALALYTFGLGFMVRATQKLALPLRIGLAVVALAPAGLLMGRPFPLGLRHVGARAESALLPWLWAINSALSVVASALAIILAIHFGFRAVFLLGLAAYGLALLVAPQEPSARPSRSRE